jgi:hypothetical protein
MNAALAFRVLGSVDGRRDLVSYRKAVARYADADPVVHPEIPAFLSIFTFPATMRQHVQATGSTRDYIGPVGVPAIRWDIDRDNDPGSALSATKHIAGYLTERYGDEGLSVYFSGSKGFHLEVDTAGAIVPANDAHQVVRRVAETIATEVGVSIDVGVYDRVRLWRAPNSRHPRTGLYKVLIELDDLPHATADGVRRRAVEPIPFDPPAPASPSLQLLDDWREAAKAVRDRADERRDRRQEVGERGAYINALTWRLITRPEEIQIGDRHRLLYSAARNLSEFSTLHELIIALLTPPGLDTGLPPRDVARQIQCGLKDSRHHQSEGGAP